MFFVHTCTVERCLMTTSVIRSSRYYRHFFSAQQKGDTYISLQKNPLMRSSINTAKCFWPVGDRNNGVPLYKEKTPNPAPPPALTHPPTFLGLGYNCRWRDSALCRKLSRVGRVSMYVPQLCCSRRTSEPG